jgi:hypothetical protein
MFERLSESVAARARGVAEDAAARIAAAYDAVPGVRAVRDGAAVRIEGRGLARRMLSDARLRWGHR